MKKSKISQLAPGFRYLQTLALKKDGIFSLSQASVSVRDKASKNSECPTEIEPMTFRTPVGRSNH